MSTPTLDYADATAQTPGPVGRFLLTPVGWPLAAAAAAVAVLTLYAASGPDAHLMPLLFATLGWIAVGGTFAFRWVAWKVAGRRFGQPRAVQLRSWWAVMPVVSAVTVTTCALGLPPAAAFRLSRPRMERAARAALAHPPRSAVPIDLGLCGPGLLHVEGNAAFFGVEGARFPDTHGFIYSPGGPPSGSRLCVPIVGPWYRFEERL